MIQHKTAAINRRETHQEHVDIYENNIEMKGIGN